MYRNVGEELPLHCVIAQKKAVLKVAVISTRQQVILSNEMTVVTTVELLKLSTDV
jgi:hypothetical protein